MKKYNDKAWQNHPSTHTEHYFKDKTPGQPSICKRTTATTGEFHKIKSPSFICMLCVQKLRKSQ